MSETIFAKIIRRELPADIVYEDDEIMAFRDINPQAPTHVLVIPKVEIATVNDIRPEQAELVGKMVLNCNRHGCQEVFHLHLHLVGGRQLRGISAG